ncbi:MAG: hypothetical protein QNL04_00730 [SAR324 cluster bacterium]|nr:hypothetical protein [SAR324 cluster bacterium]
MSNLPILNSKFPALTLKRTLSSVFLGEKPVVGDLLIRNEQGLLVKFLTRSGAAKSLCPVAILLSEPKTIGKNATATVGFSGVYWSEGVNLEGLKPKAISELEGKGIHFMTTEGLEVAPLFEDEKPVAVQEKSSGAKKKEDKGKPKTKAKVFVNNPQKARELYMKELKSFEAIASQMKLTLSTVKSYWIKDRGTIKDWDFPTSFGI